MLLTEIIPLIQIAIGPVILISGIGLILLSMTNRYARTIDRVRSLKAVLKNTSTSKPLSHEEDQLKIIWTRAKLLRYAIIMASCSVLVASALIVWLFVATLYNIQSAWFVTLLFVACLMLLIGALCAFIWDINMSLKALKLEISA